MTGKIENIHPALMDLLDELEEHMGFELTINSGYRDTAHNLDVGGVIGSEHTYNPAEGVDVLCKRSATRFKMLKWLFSYQITRIGIGADFIHIGMATDKPQDVTWTYYPETVPAKPLEI